MNSGQPAALDRNIFTIIATLKRQSKRVDINSIHTNIIKTVDFEEVATNSLISDGKHINKSNRNKDSDRISLDLAEITTESTLKFSHVFLPNTPTAVHVDLLSSPLSLLELTIYEPTPDFNIIAETPKGFRRSERIEIDDMKNEII